MSHTLTLTATRWGVDWVMTCPHGAADTTRECWPVSEEYGPYEVTEGATYGCVYEVWFGEDGVEMVTSMESTVFPFTAKWTGDCFELHLTAPLTGDAHEEATP